MEGPNRYRWWRVPIPAPASASDTGIPESQAVRHSTTPVLTQGHRMPVLIGIDHDEVQHGTDIDHGAGPVGWRAFRWRAFRPVLAGSMQQFSIPVLLVCRSPAMARCPCLLHGGTAGRRHCRALRA